MNKFYIKTQDSTAVISGDYMTIHGDYLYVYKGDDLYGMFKSDAVVSAYRTDGK